ncbi:DUF4123 domain-containing protein [Xanthomonas oryzae]|uniref:DUF4123 domain-containing protein n=1 Tax=Xanthomonas oryzae TaxID=347 RepID=UPI001F4C9AE2|nr:DUF4123 domain-containing protein [Xanthomonas oryzae]UNE64545.1 DUF4123 domain-containing protein [Xanthomonas oryzae]
MDSSADMHFLRQSQLRQLSESLQQHESQNAFILVDAYLREPLSEVLTNSCCPCIPVPINRPNVRKDQRPILIGWKPEEVEVLKESFQAAFDEQSDSEREAKEGFALGGWLLSQSDGVTVANHLAYIMQPVRPGEGRRYMRWADRRVLEWMWPQLRQFQRGALLGPITHWWTISRCNELIDHHVDGDAGARTSHGMEPTQGYWIHADRCDLVQDMLRGWQKFEPDLPFDYLDRAARAAAGAQSLGLTRTVDIVLLATYVIQIHPRLCQHPRVMECVSATLRDHGSLSQCLGDISDIEWDSIRCELKNSPNQTASSATPHIINQE